MGYQWDMNGIPSGNDCYIAIENMLNMDHRFIDDLPNFKMGGSFQFAHSKRLPGRVNELFCC